MFITQESGWVRVAGGKTTSRSAWTSAGSSPSWPWWQGVSPTNYISSCVISWHRLPDLSSRHLNTDHFIWRCQTELLSIVNEYDFILYTNRNWAFKHVLGFVIVYYNNLFNTEFSSAPAPPRSSPPLLPSSHTHRTHIPVTCSWSVLWTRWRI